MLNGGTLDGQHLSVTSDTVHPDQEDDPAHHEGIRQEDKPRAGIAAEYLSRGYILSDQILNRAIEIDKKQGISQRFVQYMSSLDTTLGSKIVGENKTVSGKVQELAGQGVEQARQVDQQRGLSARAQEYYSKAIQSSFGQRVFSFYTDTSKQILDIHEEARRIADTEKPGSAGDGTVASEKETVAGDGNATEKATTSAPTVV